jgi:hypothetical protein
MTLVTACTGASPSPVPTTATGTTAAAGTASIGPGATIEPGTTPGPTHEPAPLASSPALDRVDLRYRLIDQLGRPLFCDRDLYPVAAADEAQLAALHLAGIRADTPTYAAISAHLGIDPNASPTPDQVLAIYQDWKVLGAVRLIVADRRFGFDYIAAAGSSGEMASHVVGTIETDDTIAVDRSEPAIPPRCPICLARGTRIATPDGERLVEDLRPGIGVWTTDGSGRRVLGRIGSVGRTPVPATHQVVHLVLSDGRRVDVSPGHRLPDGRRLGDLRSGDAVDGAAVISAALVAYGGGATFDLLPSGSTGTYWANGILLASTLPAASGSVKTMAVTVR